MSAQLLNSLTTGTEPVENSEQLRNTSGFRKLRRHQATHASHGIRDTVGGLYRFNSRVNLFLTLGAYGAPVNIVAPVPHRYFFPYVEGRPKLRIVSIIQIFYSSAAT